MKKRVTLKAVAAATGFHITTVSGVLRGKPNFNAATVKKIKAAAEKMGYVPDPMLTALASYRTSSRESIKGNQIACVGLGARSSLQDWGFELVWPGMLAAAKTRGFSVEFFNANAAGMSWSRLSDILYNRGIQGVIFPEGPDSDMCVPDEFNWQRFSTVAIGDCIVQPQLLHRVMNHRSRNVVTSVDYCVKAGRRRLALATFADRERRQHRAETGSFLGALVHHGLQNKIPVFCPAKLDQKEFRTWFHRHEPDAVICSHHDLIDCLLADPAAEVPQKTSLIHYHIVDAGEPYAGVRTLFDYIGTQAIDLVISMINRGEFGLPPSNVFLQVPGVWHPGPTLIEKSP